MVTHLPARLRESNKYGLVKLSPDSHVQHLKHLKASLLLLAHGKYLEGANDHFLILLICMDGAGF